MADGLSDHTITHQLELYQALPIPQQLHNLCKLVATVHDGGSGPSKLLVQGSLCQALLKSLQGGHSPQEHDTFTLAEAWNACSSAFELIYTWEEEQVVLSVIQSWAAVSNLLCGSWLQQDQPMSCDDSGAAARPHTTTTGVTCAASDTPAGTPTAPAVAQLPSRAQHQYLDWLWSLGHGAVAAVVQQLHQFWKVTGIKHLQYQQQQQQQPRGVTSQLTSLLLLFLELHHSPPAVCSSSSDSSSQPVAQLLQLLYGKTPNAPRSTPAALTAAEAMSGVCCLLQAAAVLHVTTSSSQHTSAQTPGKAAGPAPDPMDLEESNPAAAAASIQHTAQLGSAAAPTAASAAQAWPQLAETAGRLLRDHYGWCGFGEAANMSASAAAAASEAARYTAAGYGSSPAGGVCRPSSVESLYDCFMVLLVQQMMQGPHTTSTSASFQGSGGHSTRPATSVVAAAAAAATLTAAEAPEAAAAAAGEEAVAGLLSSSLREDEWEGWLDSEVFSSLAALVATYDRPGALVRALHILTQQQLMADDMAAVAATAAAAAGGGVGEADLQVPTADSQPDRASKLSAKQASKSAMCRVLLLVEKIFLWRHHRQQQQRMQEGQSAPELTSTSSSSAAAAAGVCQLLLGLSELLRPAANCSVEWRCAALTSMLAAVEDFLSEHPDECDLELQLWCEASVEGLLYCASHDPSVQARRAALQLLQHVVLPSSSPTASALMRCLAEKVSDKDSGVATAALQLFVQLQPQVLCRCLTAAQWCSAVQAGLQLVAGTGLEGPDGQSSSKGSQRPKKPQQVENAGLRDAFVQLLQTVLLASSAPQQQQQQGRVQWLGAQSARIVGVEGCKHILLLLMCEPLLQDEWQALHDRVAAGVQ